MSIQSLIGTLRGNNLPFVSVAGRIDQPLKVARWRRAAELHAQQAQDINVLLLSGVRCSDHAFTFAEQFSTVILFEVDDRRCAAFRQELEVSDDPRAHAIAIVDSLAEGEAIVDALDQPFAFIQTGEEIEATLETRLSNTARKADYVVIQRSARSPEASDALVELLDDETTAGEREFNVSNSWIEAAKFPDWQSRLKFRTRMTAQYKAFTLQARRRKPKGLKLVSSRSNSDA